MEDKVRTKREGMERTTDLQLAIFLLFLPEPRLPIIMSQIGQVMRNKGTCSS